MSDEKGKWVKRTGKSDAHDFEQEPEFIGVYVGAKHNIGKHASTMHQFETQDGASVGVWGSTVIDGALEEATPGSLWRIVYNGYVTSDKGTKYKSFDVDEFETE